MKQIALLIFTVTTLISCSKEANNSNGSKLKEIELSNQEKELIGTWVMVGSNDTGYTNSTKEFTYRDWMMDCQRDDEYTFKANKMYSRYGGLDSSCGGSHGDYEWAIDEHGFDFVDGPAIVTKNSYIKIDANHFAAQSFIGAFDGWHKRTHIYRRK